MAKVEDAMTRSVISVPKSATIDVAIGLLIEKSLSGLPVVDEHGSLVGVITEYDILDLFPTDGTDSFPIEACEKYMTPNVRTIQKDASLEIAVKIFRATSIRRLIVMDGDRLAGVLSRRDIVRCIYESRTSLSATSA